jgi:hypothetical protein
MSMYNFSWLVKCSYILFYFIFVSRCQNSNLNWIQISLQIIKRFGKRKGILNNKTDCGPKPGRRLSPAQQPPPSPSLRRSPACPSEAACIKLRRAAHPGHPPLHARSSHGLGAAQREASSPSSRRAKTPNRALFPNRKSQRNPIETESQMAWR